MNKGEVRCLPWQAMHESTESVLTSGLTLTALCFRNRAAVAYRVRATMARCSTRGPCAAVSWGRQAAQRASAWMPMPFRQHMDVLSKSPAPAHGLAAHGWAASAKRGGLSLWLSFSLATQRESNSAAAGRRKLLLCDAGAREKASRASALLQGRALLACRVQSLPQTRGLKCDACLRRHDGGEGAWCRCGGPDGSHRMRPAPATATPPAPPHNSTAHPPRALPTCTDAPSCGWRRGCG